MNSELRTASPSLLELVRERKELSDLLTVACALIELEAGDHSANHVAPADRRKSISKTLLAFTARARTVLKALGDREIAA